MANPPTASEAIASAVRKYRRQYGWSMRELADRCAEQGATTLTQASLTNIERGLTSSGGRGSRAVTVDEMFVLAAVLGVPPAALMLPFGEANEVQLVPGVARDLLTVFRWMVGGAAAKGILNREVSFQNEPPLLKASLRAMTRLGEIEEARGIALHTRELLYGDPQFLLSARRRLDAMWEAAKPAMRAYYEHTAKRNNRPLPGLPISDVEYVKQWREFLPATYESQLRAYATRLWQAAESGDLRVLPTVPAVLYADLMALPPEQLDMVDTEEPSGEPIATRPVLPPGIEVAPPPQGDLDGDR